MIVRSGFSIALSGLALWLLGLMSAATAATPPSADPSPAWLAETQEKLGATFKNLQFEKIAPSAIPGIVEIYTQGKILYYAPAQDVLLIGELYASNGVSLTEQKIAAFAVEKAQRLDRSLALTVGEGPKEVVVFADPDCVYCKRAHAWFEEQSFAGVKQLIYFMPMTGRPQAEARALEAVCAHEDSKRAALNRVFAQQPATLDVTKSLRCESGAKRLAAQADAARAMGVYATPFFIIDGEVVAGFNQQRLTELLKPARTAAVGALKR